jgi:predicted DNA binding protein
MTNTESSTPYMISLKIENHQCKLIQMLSKLDVTDFQLIDVRSLSQGCTRHLVKLSASQIDNIPSSLFTKIEFATRARDQLAWYESDGCDVCNCIVSSGAFLVSGRSLKTGTRVYTFTTPNFRVFQTIIADLEQLGLEPEILQVEQYKRTGLLTEKQERSLWFALKLGYFEYPRKINTVTLANLLGIASSTLSESLRRGLRKLAEHHFDPS